MNRTIMLDPTTHNSDTEHLQALSLVVQALEGDATSYIYQMQAIEQPYKVANRLVQLLVEAVPREHHLQLARELRAQITDYLGS